jgi:mRNA interferase MazF
MKGLWMPTPKPKRGEIWTVDLDPTRGHEQAGRRPALVLSANLFNQGPAGLAVVLPVTSIAKGIPFHVPVDPPEGGLAVRSYVKCEDIRSVASERLSKRWGTVNADTLAEIEDRIRILLEL